MLQYCLLKLHIQAVFSVGLYTLRVCADICMTVILYFHVPACKLLTCVPTFLWEFELSLLSQNFVYFHLLLFLLLLYIPDKVFLQRG